MRSPKVGALGDLIAIIVFAEKCLLPLITSLGYMIRIIWNYYRLPSWPLRASLQNSLMVEYLLPSNQYNAPGILPKA